MRWGVRTWLRRRFRDVTGANRLAEQALTIPVGQIGIEEARFLGELVANLSGPGPIIEIGTLFGWSTRVMTLFKSPDRELITVDNYVWNPLLIPSEQHRRATAELLAEAVRSYAVKVVCQDKDAFFASYQGPAPALVFLDAVHSYDETRKDLAWARAVKAGVICVHDYSPQHPGVTRAVDELGGPRQLMRSIAVL